MLDDIKVGNNMEFLIVEAACDSEGICASYENNMDIWISVLKLSENEFSVSSLVNLKNKTARIHMAISKPFHKMISKYSIQQAINNWRL